jgi:hypothetical protein
MKRVLIVAIACAVPFWSGCAGTARPEPEYRPDEDRSVVIDRANRSVRFSGIVPIDASRQPMLEVLVCTPNTREHEALVMTSVRPSHIHAALIALGAEPGRTGGLVWNGSDFEMREPRGDRIGVRLAIEGADPIWTDAREWFTNAPASKLDTDWLFTGSRLHEGAYTADRDGTIIGLVSFTTEVVGMTPAITEIDADRGFDFVPVTERTPPFGTRVLVELKLLD